MADTSIAIIIEAQNRATAELARVGADLERFQKRAAQGSADFRRDTEDTDRKTQSLTRTLGALTSAFVRELDPAFSRASGRMRELGGGAGLLGAAFRTLGAAGLVAALGVREYVQAMADANRRTAQLNLAVKSLDFQGVVGGLRGAVVELEAFDKSLKGIILGLTRTPGSFNLLDKVFGRDSLTQFIDESRRAAPLTQRSVLGAAGAQSRGAFEAAFQGRFRSAVGFSIEDPNSNVGLADITAAGQRLSRSIEAEADAQRTKLRIEADQAVAGLAALGLDSLTGLVRQRLKDDLETVGQAFEGKLIELARFVEESRRKVLDADIVRQFSRQAGEEAPFAEAVGAGGPLGADEARGLREEAIDRSAARLQLDRDRFQVLAQISGLSQQQQVQLELQRIEAERLLQLELARKDVVNGTAKAQAADLDAQIKRFNVLQTELERTDAVAGIGKAARQIEDEWTAAGRRAEETFTQVAGTVQQTLASVLRGDVAGKNWARDFAKSIQGIFADEIAKLIVGSLTGSLRSVLGGAVSTPFGNGPADVTGASPAQLSGLLTQGYQIVGGTGGRSYAVAPGEAAGGYTLGASPSIDYSGAAFQAGSSAASSVTTGAGVGSNLAIGSGYASVAGYGAAVLGAGFAAYGLYESGRQANRYAIEQGMLQGGIAGAGIGFQVGGPIGAVIGAIVGIGFGIGFGSVGVDEYKKKVRDARRRATGSAVGSFILGVLNNQSLSVSEMLATPIAGNFTLFDLSTAQVAGHNTVGGVLLAMAGAGNSGDTAGFVFNKELIDFLRARGIVRETFRAGDLGSPEELNGAIGDANGFLADALTLLKDAANTERVPFGFVERGYDQGGTPYLTKTSYLSVGQLGAIPQGQQDIFFSSQVYKEMGLTDAQIDGIRRQLNNWTVKRDLLTDLSKERFLAAF